MTKSKPRRAKRPSESGRRERSKRKATRTAPRQQTGRRTRDSFFRELVWSMRNSVVAITRDGRIAVINDVAYRTLGIKPRVSDIGLPYSDVLADNHEILRILDGVFKLSHLPNRAELRLKSSMVIGYTLSLVRNAEKRVIGATLFFKDLTQVEQLEERERLRDRLAALGEMAAAIAHEVKNPLAGIEVMAGVLKRQLSSPDAQQLLTDIISEAKMANAIMLEVLEFVRPIQLQVERVSIADVLKDAIGMAESHIDRGDTSVHLRLANGLPDLHGDPFQLRQLFTNLLTNAFEALGGRGQVDVTTSLAGSEDGRTSLGDQPERSQPMLIEIADNGPGVPPDVTDRIFNPFFTTKPRGSGLGLAIVRKIVDAHDGRIDVGARSGGGTRFRVSLPIADDDRTLQSIFAVEQRVSRADAGHERGWEQWDESW